MLNKYWLNNPYHVNLEKEVLINESLNFKLSFVIKNSIYTYIFVRSGDIFSTCSFNPNTILTEWQSTPRWLPWIETSIPNSHPQLPTKEESISYDSNNKLLHMNKDYGSYRIFFNRNRKATSPPNMLHDALTHYIIYCIT